MYILLHFLSPLSLEDFHIVSLFIVQYQEKIWPCLLFFTVCHGCCPLSRFFTVFLDSWDYSYVDFGMGVSWWLELQIQRFTHERYLSTGECGPILHLHRRENSLLQLCSPLWFPRSHLFPHPTYSLWW